MNDPTWAEVALTALNVAQTLFLAWLGAEARSARAATNDDDARDDRGSHRAHRGP